MALQGSPDVTNVIDQSFFLTPLGGPRHPVTYLDRFPESIYTKTLDTHLVKFMYALLGPSGIGFLRKNYLEARLLLEDYGIETFDLDKFYGNPVRFGRILEETYDEDPGGLIPLQDWQKIKVQDAAYRGRAINYVKGARAGNTPLGMRLVAESGLGHSAEIIEQYKFIYDQLSDDPLGLPNFGVTDSTEEMVVIPRRDLPQSEIQVLTIDGHPTGGTIQIYFPVGNQGPNSTAGISFNANRETIQLALEAVPSIGTGNVIVEGGPLPDHPISILFTGNLGYTDVPQVQIINALTGPTSYISVETQQSGVSQADEIVNISPRDQRYLRDALEYIKPVTTIVTYNQSPGKRINQTWNSAFATSAYQEVVRYVTGQSGIKWPPVKDFHWIEAGVEHQSQRAFGDLQHHYRGFHDVKTVYSYTDQAILDPEYEDNNSGTDVRTLYTDDHIGAHTQFQRALFPLLDSSAPSDFAYTSDRILADYAEPLSITSSTNTTLLVNGIYPQDYSTLNGVPDIKYHDDQFWSSLERPVGSDYIELDLGSVQAVNYLYFEATKKPFDITISYDILDQSPSRSWLPVTTEAGTQPVNRIGFGVGALNPWQICENYFTNARGGTIFTRFIRIGFTRRSETNSPFTNDNTLLPYSVEVKNLRVARNVA